MRNTIGNTLRQKISHSNKLINFDFEYDVNNIFNRSIKPYLNTNVMVKLPIGDIKALYQKDGFSIEYGKYKGYYTFISLKEFYILVYNKICLLMVLEGYLPDTFNPCITRLDVLDYISYTRQVEKLPLFSSIVQEADNIYHDKLIYALLQEFEKKLANKKSKKYNETYLYVKIPHDDIWNIRQNRHSDNDELFLALANCKIIDNFLSDDLLFDNIQLVVSYPSLDEYIIVLYSNLKFNNPSLSISKKTS